MLSPRYYVVSSGPGRGYDTSIHIVAALTARKAHQLCIDRYQEEYDIPPGIHIYTRTLFEGDTEEAAQLYVEDLFEQIEGKTVGFKEHSRQRY